MVKFVVILFLERRSKTVRSLNRFIEISSISLFNNKNKTFSFKAYYLSKSEGYL